MLKCWEKKCVLDDFVIIYFCRANEREDRSRGNPKFCYSPREYRIDFNSWIVLGPRFKQEKKKRKREINWDFLDI